MFEDVGDMEIAGVSITWFLVCYAVGALLVLISLRSMGLFTKIIALIVMVGPAYFLARHYGGS